MTALRSSAVISPTRLLVPSGCWGQVVGWVVMSSSPSFDEKYVAPLKRLRNRKM
jgi:hypothetical protein